VENILASGVLDQFIILLAAVSAGVMVLLFYRVMIYRDPMADRLKSVQARANELKIQITGPKRRGTPRDKQLGFIHDVVERLNLLRTREARKAAEKLAQAGWRSRDALNVFFFMKLSMPFAFGIVAAFMLYGMNVVNATMMVKLILALGAVVAGAYAPDVFVKNVATKRKTIMQRGLPDALDLLVICAEAGQSLDSSLHRVAKEFGPSCPPLAEEISLTAVEIGLLPERRQALDNLNKRTDLPGIRALVNTLQQTEKYGTPLAQSLRVLAAEFRNERMLKAEAKAARLPAILTVPMIIFILPPLFIVLIGPAILRVMDMLKKM
jgi:tight adherence protein C